MGLNYDLRIGTSRQFQFQCLNPDDSVPTGQFLSSDVVSFSVWQGATGQAVITKSSASGSDAGWISATNAQPFLVLHPADTASLPQGVYYLEGTATRGSDGADLLPSGTTITLTATPGTSSARPTYIAAADIRRIAGWIDDTQAPDAETGFLEQCADARAWLDECILRNYQGGNVSLLGYHGTALAAWYTGGSRRTSLRNPFILNLLIAGPASVGPPPNGGLILTRRMIDINCYYAIHRICEGVIAKAPKYAALSARMLGKAQSMLSCSTAELSVAGSVDYAGSLLANIPINFSSTRSLYA